MENNQILQAILQEIKSVKENVKSIDDRTRKLETTQEDIKSDMQGMKNEMQGMKSDIQEIKDRTLRLEVTQENVTNKHIQLLMEGHKQLADDIKDIKQDTSQIDEIKNRLFATEAVTKENVQQIKNLQSKRKI